MLKLPEPGLHRIFLWFGFPVAIVLPLICKALLSLALLVKRISKALDPARSENVRINSAGEENLP